MQTLARRARAAFRGAELERDAGLHNWSCFLAEQGAQFGLKGLLHGLGRAPWGHELVRLGSEAVDAGLDVDEAATNALHRLGRHHIAARYPDAHTSGPAGMHYSARDAEDALADAGVVLDFVDRTWELLRA